MRKYFKKIEWYTLIPIIGAVIAVGISRWFWWYYIMSAREPGLFLLCNCCPLLIFIIVFLIALGLLIRHSLKKTQSFVPTLVLFLGIAVVFLIPLDDPPSADIRYFLERRSDFEAVVELASERQLEHMSQWPCNTQSYLATSNLQHVSGAGCMEIFYADAGLIIYFHPLDGYSYQIVYAELADMNPCKTRPYLIEKIDTHWYFCAIDN